MTSDALVREWARSEGMEVPQRGRLNPSFHERYREAHPDDDQDDGAPQLDDDQAPEERRPLQLVDEQADTGETPPRAPRRGVLDKIRSGRKSGAPKRRVSLDTLCASAWTVLASAASSQGLTPTGRVLAMQAPVAGSILEDSLRGTVADRVMQPLARLTQKGSEVGALLGPPVIVTALTLKPQAAPQLIPVLKLALRQWVMVAGPAMKKQEQKSKRAMEALGLDDEKSLEAMIDGMVDAIFTPPDVPAAADRAA